MSAQLPLLMIAEGRKPRPRKATVAPEKESRVQCDVAAVLSDHALPEWRWSHFPAGERRDVITGAKLKRDGLQCGWPDMVLLSPLGAFHGLELKRLGEVLTEDQKAFQLWADKHSVPYTVAYSFDEALAVLDAWGCLRIRMHGGAR
jgi:hypothetical protein